MTYFNKYETVSNDLIYAIIGKDEYLHAYKDDIIDKDNLVLISIHDPSHNYHPENKVEGFVDVLQVKFWDTEYDFDSIPTIPKDMALEIRDFIIKHKDRRFMIHCHAGMSRSAGVGMAVECLIKYDGDAYEYLTSENSITEHPRYCPNRVVFDKIVKD